MLETRVICVAVIFMGAYSQAQEAYRRDNGNAVTHVTPVLLEAVTR